MEEKEQMAGTRESAMRRIAVAAILLWAWVAGASLLAEAGAVGTPGAPTRAVSLRALQSRLQRALAKGEVTDDLLHLCGITRVVGYVVDESNRDLVLLGEVEPGAPPLHVEDLAVALRNAWLRYASRQGRTLFYSDPGCSIDPDPRVIQRLNEIGQSEAMGEEIDDWCATCAEPQTVRVMGVPFDSHFAKVMVEADYLMKRAVDGSLELGIPGFTSLASMTLAIAHDDLAAGRPLSLPRSSLNRFWFYLGKAGFQEEEGVVTIEHCPVVLLTEEQHLTREGLSGLSRPDPLAQRFAESFGAHYRQIAAKRPIYLELEGLFRFAALAQLIKYQRVKADLDYLLDQFPVHEVRVDRTLPGIYRVKSIEKRRDIPGGYETTTLWLPTCGGVNMAVRINRDNFRQAPAKKTTHAGKQAAGGRKAQILKARPSPDALSWDISSLRGRWQ
jgi:hypothetical protein